MTITPDDHKRSRFQGQACAAMTLATLIRSGIAPELAESFATGMAEGVADFATAYVSDKAAYDLLQGAADKVAARIAAPSRQDQRT